jgi:hypothetical protein
MDASWITLREWASQYFERPPAYETVVRYAREDMIQPPPVIVNGVYRVSPDAMLVRLKRGASSRGRTRR